MKVKYTLITNLSFVQLQGTNLRLDCHALLVTEDAGSAIGPSYTLRGFGTDPAWPVFTYWLEKDALPFELARADSAGSAVILGQDGAEKPLFQGALLRLKGEQEFFLQTDSSERPLDVHEQEDGDIMAVWALLYDKVAEYWHAPYMPRLTYGPPSKAGNRYAEMAVR